MTEHEKGTSRAKGFNGGQIGKAKEPVADGQYKLMFTLFTQVSLAHKGLDYWFRG